LKAKGLHYLIELSGCTSGNLDDINEIRKIITSAAEKAEAEIRGVTVHRFSPQGVSGVVVIAESHLSIHTWPEYNYASADIFTCGENTRPEEACKYIANELKASNVVMTVIERGIELPEKKFDHEIKKFKHKKYFSNEQVM